MASNTVAGDRAWLVLLVAVPAVFLVFGSLDAETSATRAPRGSISGHRPDVRNVIATGFRDLDRVYLESGEQALRSVFEAGSEQEIMALLDWIAERGLRDLYGLLAAAAADPRRQVKLQAIYSLQRVKPADLGDRLSTIRAAQTKEEDKLVKGLLEAIVTSIEDSGSTGPAIDDQRQER